MSLTTHTKRRPTELGFGYHTREAPKPAPTRMWICKCPGQRPRPAYMLNCGDCYGKRPY